MISICSMVQSRSSKPSAICNVIVRWSSCKDTMRSSCRGNRISLPWWSIVSRMYSPISTADRITPTGFPSASSTFHPTRSLSSQHFPRPDVPAARTGVRVSTGCFPALQFLHLHQPFAFFQRFSLHNEKGRRMPSSDKRASLKPSIGWSASRCGCCPRRGCG